MTVNEKRGALINAGYVIHAGIGGRVYVEHDDFMHVGESMDKAVIEAYDLAFPGNKDTFTEAYDRAMRAIG